MYYSNASDSLIHNTGANCPEGLQSLLCWIYLKPDLTQTRAPHCCQSCFEQGGGDDHEISIIMGPYWLF